MYAIIPISVLVLLLLIRPGFLYWDKSDNKGNVTRSISFQKVLLSWLVLSSLFAIGLVGYNYSKKN